MYTLINIYNNMYNVKTKRITYLKTKKRTIIRIYK